MFEINTVLNQKQHSVCSVHNCSQKEESRLPLINNLIHATLLFLIERKN